MHVHIHFDSNSHVYTHVFILSCVCMCIYIQTCIRARVRVHTELHACVDIVRTAHVVFSILFFPFNFSHVLTCTRARIQGVERKGFKKKMPCSLHEEAVAKMLLDLDSVISNVTYLYFF